MNGPADPYRQYDMPIDIESRFRDYGEPSNWHPPRRISDDVRQICEETVRRINSHLPRSTQIEEIAVDYLASIRAYEIDLKFHTEIYRFNMDADAFRFGRTATMEEALRNQILDAVDFYNDITRILMKACHCCEFVFEYRNNEPGTACPRCVRRERERKDFLKRHKRGKRLLEL